MKAQQTTQSTKDGVEDELQALRLQLQEVQGKAEANAKERDEVKCCAACIAA